VDTEGDRQVKLLIAEDDPVSRRLLEATLTKWGYEVTVCTNGVQALEALQREDAPRLAILDWMMPEMDGVQVCREVRKRAEEPYTYILLLTAKCQKEELVEGLDAEADDYLTKPFDPSELRARVRSGIRILELQADLIAAREELRKQATHDPLTGLWHHSAILDILRREFSRSKRENTPLCVLMLDIDRFKRFNDTYGHQKGDLVLREIAESMHQTLRDYDMLGRYGGEEFLIVLPACNPEQGVVAAERLRKHVASKSIDTPDGPVHVTVSVGVAADAQVGKLDANVLLRAADVALYRAKDAGRNRTELATPGDLSAEMLVRTPRNPPLNN